MGWMVGRKEGSTSVSFPNSFALGSVPGGLASNWVAEFLQQQAALGPGTGTHMGYQFQGYLFPFARLVSPWETETVP